MTRESEFLATETTRTATGDPWYGPSARALLVGVDAAAASARIPGATHTIWELVLHASVWARYAAYRVRGGEPREPAEGDWPPADGSGEDAWRDALDRLVEAHADLADALRAATDDDLDAEDESTPRDETGDAVTLRRVAAGAAQHTAYHLGQIAMLERLVRGARSDA